MWDLVWFLQEAIFLLIFFSKGLRFDLRWEFEPLSNVYANEIGLGSGLKYRENNIFWSEIG